MKRVVDILTIAGIVALQGQLVPAIIGIAKGTATLPPTMLCLALFGMGCHCVRAIYIRDGFYIVHNVAGLILASLALGLSI